MKATLVWGHYSHFFSKLLVANETSQKDFFYLVTENVGGGESSIIC